MTTLPRTSDSRPAAAELNRGLANGMEIAGVVLFFFFVGFLLDHWLGTLPWFSLVLTVIGIVGVFVRAYYAYSAEMERLDAQRRAPRVTPTGDREP